MLLSFCLMGRAQRAFMSRFCITSCEGELTRKALTELKSDLPHCASRLETSEELVGVSSDHAR